LAGNSVLIGSHDSLGRDVTDTFSGLNFGAAYLFDGATGGLVRMFQDATPRSPDGFGNAVALTATKVVAGVPGKGVARVYDGAVSASLPRTYFVTNTNDSGPGCLRQAPLNSNASVGVRDTINFVIGNGAQTIRPASALPVITDPVTIDATTQVGYAGSPLIELNGTSAGTQTSG